MAPGDEYKHKDFYPSRVKVSIFFSFWCLQAVLYEHVFQDNTEIIRKKGKVLLVLNLSCTKKFLLSWSNEEDRSLRNFYTHHREVLHWTVLSTEIAAHEHLF